MLAERTGAAARERWTDQLEVLSRTAKDFVGMEDDADPYQYIAERVRECTPGAWVSVSSYDAARGQFTVRAFAGSDHDRSVFDEELPRPLIGTIFSMDGTPMATVVLSCQTLTDARSPFYLLSAQTVPEEICTRIDERLILGRAYAMSFTCRGGVYGVVTFRFAKGIELENRELVQAFISQASVALLRQHVRARLRKSETRYRAVVESQRELICRFAPAGTHHFANEAYCQFFGLDLDRIAGSRFVPDALKPDRAAFAGHFRAFAPERPDETIDHRIRLPGGDVRWLQ
jgi:PAS domain S-box-containing protein